MCVPCTPFNTATAVVPVSVHIVMLGVVMFLMGMMLGALDNGKGRTLCSYMKTLTLYNMYIIQVQK